MTAMTTTPGTYEGKTAQQWRDEAAQLNRESFESYERCGADGSLSQWGKDSLATEYRRKAELAERGGIWEFPALFHLDGTLATDQTVSSEWGWSWYVARPRDGKRYVTTSKARKGERRLRADEAKGYRIGTIRRAAVVKAAGSIGSLSYYYAPDPKSEAYEIVDNGTTHTCYEDWSN